jgi:hypothetical protein
VFFQLTTCRQKLALQYKQDLITFKINDYIGQTLAYLAESRDYLSFVIRLLSTSILRLRGHDFLRYILQ